MSLDTADRISYDGLPYVVACNHDGYVHLMMHPDTVVHESLCKLIGKASEAERLELLQRLAASTWSAHRNNCARERLEALAQVYDGGGC